jgi:hypothetical protein|tara:strand:- start:1063 stop:1176 length:114 start_codon:yes stop_codon:yes gene_type:complete
MTGENITLAAAIFLASAKLIAFCIWGFGENSTNGETQ